MMCILFLLSQFIRFNMFGTGKIDISHSQKRIALTCPEFLPIVFFNFFTIKMIFCHGAVHHIEFDQNWTLFFLIRLANFSENCLKFKPFSNNIEHRSNILDHFL